MIVAIDNKGVSSNYKINEKENWIIIFDVTTAITMYEIKYSIGMSESCSSIIFSALLKEYKKLSEQYHTTSERSLEENNLLQTDLDSIDIYLKTLHQQIELLNQTKKIEQEKIKFNTIQMNNLKSNLDNLAMKIVKPQNFI